MTLPDDIVRCHDSDCGARRHCERWLQRFAGGQRVVHAYTMAQTWQCRDVFCEHAIPVDGAPAELHEVNRR